MDYKMIKYQRPYEEYCLRAMQLKQYVPTEKEFEHFDNIRNSIDELMTKKEKFFLPKNTSMTLFNSRKNVDVIHFKTESMMTLDANLVSNVSMCRCCPNINVDFYLPDFNLDFYTRSTNIEVVDSNKNYKLDTND